MKTAFAPVIHSKCNILILGTMPGVRSLELQQYYGHTGNQFWKILFALFDEPFTKDYEKRIDLVQRKHIALWDVLSHCEAKEAQILLFVMKSRTILRHSMQRIHLFNMYFLPVEKRKNSIKNTLV